MAATPQSTDDNSTVGDTYREHLLEARDVCRNCLQLVRVERLDPVRGGLGHELDSHYSRNELTTSVEYAPHECPPRSKGVFCSCGVESARERLWESVDRDRFKDLLTNAVRSAEHKGVTFARKPTLAVALQSFTDGDSVDKAIAKGLDAGIASAVASE